MAANKKGTRRNLPGKPNSPKPPIRQTLSVQQEIRLSQLPDPEVLEKYQQIFAAVLGTIAILGGVYAAINGAEISGGLLGSGGIVGIIIAFLVSSRLNKQK